MLGTLVKGALAGAIGTLAMDAVWFRRYRDGGGDQGFTDWEFATDTTSFEDAGAPGKVGQLVAGKAGVDLPDEAAGLTTNVVHWLTGVGYGIGHALSQRRRGVVPGGVLTGVGAFLSSYASLGALGIYEPIWEYDEDTLAKDLTAHLAFGLATAVAFRALEGSRDGAEAPEPGARADG